MLVLNMILFNKFFNDILIPKYRELLLKRWFLFLSNIQFNQWGVNVLHNFEQVERKGNVNVWTVYKLIQWVLKKSLNEMIQKYLIFMRCLNVPFTELITTDIKKLILILAGAFCIWAFDYMHIDNSNHGHPVWLIVMNTLWKVSHIVNLD